MARNFHVRYTIGFYDAAYEDTRVYSDFKNIIENRFHGNYTFDATFYIEFTMGIGILEHTLNKIFDDVLNRNNLSRNECYLKYDICTESTPVNRRIRLR